jgi:hypothetical protein
MRKIFFALIVALVATTANASTWTLVGKRFLDGHYYCTYQAPNTNVSGADPRFGGQALTTTIELQPGQSCPTFINR